jgi:hypothetical protein
VQHVLDKITDTKGTSPIITDPTPSATQTDADAITRDPISLARAMVHFVRASSTRRIAFENIIKQGNKDGDFATPDNPNHQIRNIQLLRDMEVRWDSTYYMIRRVLEMRPVRFNFFLLFDV